MRDWNKENLADLIRGEKNSLDLFGSFISDLKEKARIEIYIEEISEKVINRIDESIVADFDYTDESLDSIENIISDGFWGTEDEIDPDLMEDLVMDIGSYLGITIINNLGGEWRFRSDLLHSSVYFKSIEAECFPFHRVSRRLLFGKDESLSDFYLSLLQILGVV